MRNVAVLVVVGLVLGVALSALVQKGTDEDRRMAGVSYPSRFALIFTVIVVVLIVGSFFVHWD